MRAAENDHFAAAGADGPVDQLLDRVLVKRRCVPTKEMRQEKSEDTGESESGGVVPLVHAAAVRVRVLPLTTGAARVVCPHGHSAD